MRCIADSGRPRGPLFACQHFQRGHLDPGLHHLGRLVGGRGSLLKSLALGTCCHCS